MGFIRFDYSFYSVITKTLGNVNICFSMGGGKGKKFKYLNTDQLKTLSKASPAKLKKPNAKQTIIDANKLPCTELTLHGVQRGIRKKRTLEKS